MARRPAGDRIVLGMTRRGIELVPDGKGGYVGKDVHGRPALSIEPPTVADANGRPGKVSLTLTADTATFQLDPTFLASAAYPIVVDPTVLYLQESMSSSSGGYEGVVLGDSPLAYFRLNEQAGAPGAPITVLDLTGGYTGTTVADVTPNQVGALAAGGDSDPAMRFEGTNRGHIQVSPGFEDLSGGVTLEAWIYPTAASNWSRIVSIGNWSFWTGATDTISLGRVGGSDELFFSTPTGSLSVPGALVLNTWAHVVGSQDASGALALYVNGRRVASGTAAGPIPGPVTRSVNYLGKSAQASYDGPYVGTIDEVAIYRLGLTATQVQSHFLAGRPEAPPPASAYASAVMADAPTAYWRLDDTTVPVARDVTATRDAMHIGPVGINQAGALVGGEGGSLGLGQPGAYVDLQPDQTDFSGGLTLEAWIKSTEVRAWTRMFMLNNNTNGNGNQGISLLRNGGGDDLLFGIPSAGLLAPGALTPNTWRHVVGTVTAQGYARLYVDGQLVTEGQAQPVATTPRGLGYIGKSDWNQDPAFAGSIDEVALYDHPLTPERVATHYAIGRGAPLPPVVEVSAQTNPITISWSAAAGILKYDLWYQVDGREPAHLAEVDGSTTNLGIHVGGDADFRFGIQATNALGTSPTSWSVPIHSTLGDEGDDDDGPFDPAAEPLCIPASHPDPYNLVQRLLLSRLVCGAPQEAGQWHQTSPLSDLLCPGIGPVVPVPGAAILSVNDPVCKELSGTAVASVGQRPDQGAIERIKATITEMEGLVNQGLAPAAAVDGLRRILSDAERALQARQYGMLNGFPTHAERALTYAQEQGMRLRDVEALSSTWFPTGVRRFADLVVNMVETTASGGTVNRVVIVEVKHWTTKSLQTTKRVEQLQKQIKDSLKDTNYRVVVEFVETKTNPIRLTPSQVADALDLAEINVDLSRLDFRHF